MLCVCVCARANLAKSFETTTNRARAPAPGHFTFSSLLVRSWLDYLFPCQDCDGPKRSFYMCRRFSLSLFLSFCHVAYLYVSDRNCIDIRGAISSCLLYGNQPLRSPPYSAYVKRERIKSFLYDICRSGSGHKRCNINQLLVPTPQVQRMANFNLNSLGEILGNFERFKRMFIAVIVVRHYFAWTLNILLG